MEKEISILLAEDDINLGHLLHTFLKSKGFKVTLAQNGKIAFEKFNADTFQFCIFDVMMPEMDGFTLAKEIREIDKKVSILFLTAKSMKEDKLEGFEIGADDYLTTKENQLLKLLVKNQNEILDRQATLRAIWGDDNYFNGRSMDVYIAKLRKALREDDTIEIMNVHGKGFKLVVK